MKCIYFSEGAIEYKKMRTEIITALVIEEEARDAFRQSLNDLFGQCFGPEYKTYPIYWDDIDDENVSAYCHVIRLFNINPNAASQISVQQYQQTVAYVEPKRRIL